jgi:small subunit ribosomal protein S1
VGTWEDHGVTMPVTYQVTKYDPADFGPSGYIGVFDTDDDPGPERAAQLHAAYGAAVESFATELGVTHLEVRDPELVDPASITSPDLLDVIGPGAERFFDGAMLPLADALTLVVAMIQAESRWFGEPAPWCRLESDRLVVHVGYDEYLYVGVDAPCPRAVAAAREAGLFPLAIPTSPYIPEDSELQDSPRPIDNEFWEELDKLVRAQGGVLILEYSGWHRWHRIDRPGHRPPLRPRAQVSVWPDVTRRRATLRLLLTATSREDFGWLLGLTATGQLRSHQVGLNKPGTVVRLLTGLVRARFVSMMADRWQPLMEGTLPDADGVVRARVPVP